MSDHPIRREVRRWWLQPGYQVQSLGLELIEMRRQPEESQD
jgi:hypothetical protein